MGRGMLPKPVDARDNALVLDRAAAESVQDVLHSLYGTAARTDLLLY
jgi:hypothetical protein